MKHPLDLATRIHLAKRSIVQLSALLTQEDDKHNEMIRMREDPFYIDQQGEYVLDIRSRLSEQERLLVSLEFQVGE